MASSPRMPWGKFKGQLLCEIESSYLAWCFDHADALSVDLHDAIVAELGSRFNPLPPCPDPDLARDLIGTGLRVLAKKTHPDIGGNTQTMQRLNATAEWLKGLV